MTYEFENELEPRWFKTLGDALEYASNSGNRIVRYY